MSKIFTVMASMLLTFSVFAAEWTDEQTGYTWSYFDLSEGVEIYRVSPNSGKDLVIPNKINNKTVVSIGYNAFKDCSDFVGSLIIPDSVRIIKGFAFQNCKGLSGSLIIPDSVEVIEACAFEGCSGFSGHIKISNSLESIPANCFNGCRNISGDIIIPDSVLSIGVSAFANCTGFNGLLRIGCSVTFIDSNAFYNCNGLVGSLAIPDGVTTIGYGAFEGCCGFNGHLTIGNAVTLIPPYAFSGCCGLRGPLIIPDSVVSIGGYAFKECQGFVGALTIGRSLSFVDPWAFYLCGTFENVYFPNGINKSQELLRIPYTLGVFVGRRYAHSWSESYIPVEYIRGYIGAAEPIVDIISSQIRDSDPTVMDVVYRVTSTKPTVKVRVLAFEDGERSFAKVVRPTTFIDGTAANVGDAVTANEEHTISWKVSADWQERLAKFKMDIFAMEEGDGLLPLELTTIPGTDSHPNTVQFSWNYIGKDVTLEALYWLYADNDLGLTLQNGQLKHGSQTLANGASVNGTGYDALVYVYDKMGYQLLEGDEYEYVKKASRLNLPDKSVRQYAYKVIEQ